MNSDLPRAGIDALIATAKEFIAYYGRGGGCSNCGGLPHADTCFVRRFEAALGPAPRRPQEPQQQDDSRYVCTACGHPQAVDGPSLKVTCEHCGARPMYVTDRGARRPQELDMTITKDAFDALRAARDYTSKIVVESDGYPMSHSAADIRTILQMAFLEGVEYGRGARRSPEEAPPVRGEDGQP